MSLNWNWSDKIGSCTYNYGLKCNLYRGNAFVIAIHEREDHTYDLAWFAADEAHLKNLLGLNKGYDNIMQDWGIVELELNTEYKETTKIVNLMAKAKMKITIKLY